ncbi:MAG TPA: aminodeoxychorismate synthase component I [candidate division Zixibacteria bacterium]|nr:aminodeoxychorismate synthase component I [candidate division Zixibacteria bacterium]
MENQVVIQDKQGSRWLRFRDPEEVISVNSIDGVMPALEKIDQIVNARGLYAAGFICYEASPAFDSALTTHAPSTAPLMWFGLYHQPEEIVIPVQAPSYELGDWLPSVNETDYGKAIERIKTLIAEGRTYQVNYTIRLRSKFQGDPWGIFLDMIRAQESRYAAYVELGPLSICSTSPELFFELNGNELISRPMKGTAERGRTLAEDRDRSDWLHNSEKNRAENVMIVDMIRNDVGRVSQIGSVHVPRLFSVERYPTVWQMTSTVRSQTKASIPEILSALFPCASITGAPKVSTMEIIADLESTPRGVYTGCIGYIAPGRYSQFNVAIRTVVVNKSKGEAEYGVGGGIVWDSTAKEEYQECQTKTRVLTERRPEFELLESLLWTPEEDFFLLEEHLHRLSESGEYFGFELDIDRIRAALDNHISSSPRQAKKIRLTISRRGVIAVEGIPISCHEPARIGLSINPINRDDVFLYHKTTHRDMYDKAMHERPDCDDVLLWNEEGEITESTTANMVVGFNGCLFTPPVESGLLPGTFRRTLLEEGVIEERAITLADLEKRDSLFLINSVRKWRRASLIKEYAGQQLSQP